MREVRLKIEGMHCGACVKRVTMSLEKLGAKIEEVEVGSARLKADDSVTDSAMLAALQKSGYSASVVH